MKNELKFIDALNKQDQYFYSHDMGLVAYLLCENYKLINLDKSKQSKVLFILKKDGRNIDKDIKDYWNSESSIDAQTFFNQVKRLKNQIHSS